MKSRYTRVIWDFNGTLLDDVDLCIELLNRLRAQRGLALPLSIDRYREIFRFPVRAYYELAGFDFSHEPFETVAHQWVAAYNRSEPGTGLRAGALHLLGKLSRDGVRQAVLSATESAMLERQLNRLGIRDYFDRVCGRSDVYAADKAALARSFAAELPGERAVLIGDTDHDYTCARAAGFDCILLCGGHQSRAVLAATGAPVAADFEELEGLLYAVSGT